MSQLDHSSACHDPTKWPDKQVIKQQRHKLTLDNTFNEQALGVFHEKMYSQVSVSPSKTGSS